jgi:hypothetical protein
LKLWPNACNFARVVCNSNCYLEIQLLINIECFVNNQLFFNLLNILLLCRKQRKHFAFVYFYARPFLTVCVEAMWFTAPFLRHQHANPEADVFLFFLEERVLRVSFVLLVSRVPNVIMSSLEEICFFSPSELPPLRTRGGTFYLQ